MILIDTVGNTSVILSNDFRWTDEFDWLALAQQENYSISGELIVQQNTKQIGRTITLEPPDPEMCWTTRSAVMQLYSWANSPGKKLTLQLEYPTDTRSFLVMFRQGTGNEKPVEAKPVRPWSALDGTEEWAVTLRLIEVEA